MSQKHSKNRFEAFLEKQKAAEDNVSQKEKSPKGSRIKTNSAEMPKLPIASSQTSAAKKPQDKQPGLSPGKMEMIPEKLTETDKKAIVSTTLAAAKILYNGKKSPKHKLSKSDKDAIISSTTTAANILYKSKRPHSGKNQKNLVENDNEKVEPTNESSGDEKLETEEIAEKRPRTTPPPSRRPVQCPICMQTFSNSSNMQRHALHQHGQVTKTLEETKNEDSDIYPITIGVGKSFVYDFGNQTYAIYSFNDDV